jgi:hypothetical protein
MDYVLHFGSCCACEREDESVRNVVALSVKAPMPNTGWGCMVCGLPLNGALAVVCDTCMEEKRPIVWVIYGMALSGERVLRSTCTEPFEHNLQYHPEERME